MRTRFFERIKAARDKRIGCAIAKRVIASQRKARTKTVVPADVPVYPCGKIECMQKFELVECIGCRVTRGV
jgi:hypothetical protein